MCGMCGCLLRHTQSRGAYLALLHARNGSRIESLGKGMEGKKKKGKKKGCRTIIIPLNLSYSKWYDMVFHYGFNLDISNN